MDYDYAASVHIGRLLRQTTAFNATPCVIFQAHVCQPPGLQLQEGIVGSRMMTDYGRLTELGRK